MRFTAGCAILREPPKPPKPRSWNENGDWMVRMGDGEWGMGHGDGGSRGMATDCCWTDRPTDRRTATAGAYDNLRLHNVMLLLHCHLYKRWSAGRWTELKRTELNDWSRGIACLYLTGMTDCCPRRMGWMRSECPASIWGPPTVLSIL